MARSGFAARSFGGIGPLLIGLLLLIVVPVVVVILLNELAPMFFGNLTGLITTLTGVSTGSGIGDAILTIFGVILLPIVGVVFFVSLAVDAFKKRGGGGSV
jgi:hypothetical protein